MKSEAELYDFINEHCDTALEKPSPVTYLRDRMAELFAGKKLVDAGAVDELLKAREEIERLKAGMAGDYDLDAWLGWAKEKQTIQSEIERLKGLLREAAVDIERWGGYAPIKLEQSLANDIRKYREAGG